MCKIGSRKLLYNTVNTVQCCDDLERRDGGCGGKEAQQGVIYVYTWPIHIVVWQKPA